MSKSLKWYLLYYAVMQLFAAITYETNSRIAIVEILLICMFLLALVFPFIRIISIKSKDLISSAKEAINEHWVSYLLITLLMMELNSGKITNLFLHLTSFNIPTDISFTPITKFVYRYIHELFFSNTAVLFFIAVPFLSNMMEISKQNKIQ